MLESRGKYNLRDQVRGRGPKGQNTGLAQKIAKLWQETRVCGKMRNLGNLSDGKCLIRYIKDRGRCTNIRIQIFPMIWPSKRNYPQNPRRGKWTLPRHN